MIYGNPQGVFDSVKRLQFLIIGLLMFSCGSDSEELETVDSPVDYSFFIAGHVYGSPDNYIGGMYEPFIAQVNDINADEDLEFGVLLGDVVKYSLSEYWDMLSQDMVKFSPKLHLAPGNHDVDSLGLMNQYFDMTNGVWTDHNDLFILLDLNGNEWNVDDDQLKMIKDAVKMHDPSKGNIFVFTHQLFWRDHERYNKIGVNSKEGMSDNLTFWSEVAPIFQELDCQTYFLAGDVGAFDWATFAFYDEMDNLTFIATGMGGLQGDNYIIVDVHENKEVSFRLISLDATIDLGPLEDY